MAGPGETYKPCDRCVKHNLKCSIDNDFKRLGKRAAHEEMVKELEVCKSKLARFEALGMHLPEETPQDSTYTGSYQASPASYDTFLTAQPRDNTPDGVFIGTDDSSTNSSDTGFSLLVTC